jgi:hypothetical protein
MPYEYNKSTVSGNGCSYNNLNGYNRNYFGRGSAPIVSQAMSSNVLVIPSYGSSGFDVAQRRPPSCSGYYNINSAYPNYPNTCGSFSSSMC